MPDYNPALPDIQLVIKKDLHMISSSSELLGNLRPKMNLSCISGDQKPQMGKMYHFVMNGKVFCLKLISHTIANAALGSKLPPLVEA